VSESYLTGWTARHVKNTVLSRRHGQEYNGGTPRWIWFEELSCRTSFNPPRIDLWVMDTWGDKNAIAYEVKVSRSDFLREIANPAKREPAMAVSNFFYFAAPRDLIAASEVPEGCGLVEVIPRTAKVVVRAPRRSVASPSWEFLAAVGRGAFRLVRQEGVTP